MKNLFYTLLLTGLTSTAFAGANCEKHPESEWLTPLDLQKKIVNEYNFAIKKFKVDGNCYEIYGWETSAAGKEQKVEVYFDTKTGDIVKKEVD